MNGRDDALREGPYDWEGRRFEGRRFEGGPFDW